MSIIGPGLTSINKDFLGGMCDDANFIKLKTLIHLGSFVFLASWISNLVGYF